MNKQIRSNILSAVVILLLFLIFLLAWYTVPDGKTYVDEHQQYKALNDGP